MSSSVTDWDGGVGIAYSAGSAGLFRSLVPRILSGGLTVSGFDLDCGEGCQLEEVAGSGRLRLLVELGLGDFLARVIMEKSAPASRLTGAIRGRVPQLWVLCPGVVPKGGEAEDWDNAGKHLAWLASAGDLPPEVLVGAEDGMIGILAQSFSLWAVPGVVPTFAGVNLADAVVDAIMRVAAKP